MAKRKRSRKRRLSSAALLSAPRRRRRSRTSLSTAPRRRKRNRGMSELSLVKGKTGTIVNPVLEGSIGAGVQALGNKLIPSTMITGSTTLAPHEKMIRRGFGYLLALGAAYMKQPLVAAGIAGANTALLLQEQGVLQEEGMGRRLVATKYARPNLLSNPRLLSEGNRSNIYAPYQAQRQMQTMSEQDERDELLY